MLAMTVLNHVSFVQLQIFVNKTCSQWLGVYRLNRDCANICVTASQFMSRDSEYSKKICAICTDICDACVQECEKYTDMEHSNCVLRRVEDVLKNVGKWLDEGQCFPFIRAH